MADPIFMLSLVNADDADDAAGLDAGYVAAPWPADAFARAYGPFVETMTSLPLVNEVDDRPLRIAG